MITYRIRNFVLEMRITLNSNGLNESNYIANLPEVNRKWHDNLYPSNSTSDHLHIANIPKGFGMMFDTNHPMLPSNFPFYENYRKFVHSARNQCHGTPFGVELVCI